MGKQVEYTECDGGEREGDLPVARREFASLR